MDRERRWLLQRLQQQAEGIIVLQLRAGPGAVSPGLISLARSLGFITIQWDVDPGDWSRPGSGAIYANVTGNAHDGAIIIQHDGGALAVSAAE